MVRMQRRQVGLLYCMPAFFRPVFLAALLSSPCAREVTGCMLIDLLAAL